MPALFSSAPTAPSLSGFKMSQSRIGASSRPVLPPALPTLEQAPAPVASAPVAAPTEPQGTSGGAYGDRSGEYFSLLDALKSRGYLGNSAASSSASGNGLGGNAGVWTPEMPPSAGSGAPAVAGVDTSAKNAAIFARAKDQVGQTGTGALAGLRSALAGRGMLGSGGESRGTVNVVNAGQQQLGDTTRENAIQDAAIGEREALANQQAQIATRGQDIEAVNARNAGRLTARGQDLSARESALSRASASRDSNAASVLALWNAFSGGRY